MRIPGTTPGKTRGKTPGKKKTSTAAGLFIDLLSKTYDLGKYDNTCWTIALIDDKEFGRLRSPNIHKCGDQLYENDWMNMHSFETKWDLGVEN